MNWTGFDHRASCDRTRFFCCAAREGGARERSPTTGGTRDVRWQGCQRQTDHSFPKADAGRAVPVLSPASCCARRHTEITQGWGRGSASCTPPGPRISHRTSTQCGGRTRAKTYTPAVPQAQPCRRARQVERARNSFSPKTDARAGSVTRMSPRVWDHSHDPAIAGRVKSMALNQGERT